MAGAIGSSNASPRLSSAPAAAAATSAICCAASAASVDASAEKNAPAIAAAATGAAAADDDDTDMPFLARLLSEMLGTLPLPDGAGDDRATILDGLSMAIAAMVVAIDAFFFLLFSEL
ncbi:Os08g0119900 [Oryza sativa Japonica Group]|uniref:Os08g0119900 protein n=1 Tax=Oryza sativa subsp. japonica TaxID=39947 RepID=Q6ZJ40_ORYSJ|nr:unknown protein [Oryza sativa Japonica Group]BAF22789.1 Os08g0119900 [Oryza sativa Japonica Group]|eukprot:NP_001060875.1 Os08g0119900 [Oryza sativa Japonica Group]